MTWVGIISRISQIAHGFVEIASVSYDMIIENKLLLAFVLMCAIFVGVGLLKRLLDI